MRIGVSATYMWSDASYQNAGISRYSFRLIDALIRLPGEDEYEIFANDAFRPPAEWLDLPRVHVHPIVPNRRGGRAKWEWWGAAGDIRARGIQTWLSTANTVPFGARVPTVAMIHDMIAFERPEDQEGIQSHYLRWALKTAARRSSRIVTNSEATKGEIVRHAGVSKDKVVVTPLGPGNAIVPIRPEEARVDVPFDRFFFALGTLEPRKNIPVLFEALARLEDRTVGLVVGGGRGWKEAGIFEAVERLNVADRVHFAGYVPDEALPSLFARCEAFVYPSLMEGFGMPVLEAMLAGAPVLASTDPALREVGGDAATYFDPHDPDSVSKALAAPRDRAAMVRRGFERAGEFTWERCARLTREALESVSRG